MKNTFLARYKERIVQSIRERVDGLEEQAKALSEKAEIAEGEEKEIALAELVKVIEEIDNAKSTLSRFSNE